MKVHKQPNGAVTVTMSSLDLAKLRRGWEVLEELAHYGRHEGLMGMSGEVFSAEFLEKTAVDVATLLVGVSPRSDTEAPNPSGS